MESFRWFSKCLRCEEGDDTSVCIGESGRGGWIKYLLSIVGWAKVHPAFDSMWSRPCKMYRKPVWLDEFGSKQVWRSSLYTVSHKTSGLVRDLNPGPRAPEARIIPLDQRAGTNTVILMLIIFSARIAMPTGSWMSCSCFKTQPILMLSYASEQRSIWVLVRRKQCGLVRDLNPGPLAPKARIIPLDQRAIADVARFWEGSDFSSKMISGITI